MDKYCNCAFSLFSRIRSNVYLHFKISNDVAYVQKSRKQLEYTTRLKCNYDLSRERRSLCFFDSVCGWREKEVIANLSHCFAQIFKYGNIIKALLHFTLERVIHLSLGFPSEETRVAVCTSKVMKLTLRHFISTNRS